MSRMLTPSSAMPVGICTLMTAFSVGQFEQRRRHDVEVGRHGRHQRAAIAREHADGGHDRGVAAEPVSRSSGSPMPAVITGNAAKALPMTMVNSAMPTA